MGHKDHTERMKKFQNEVSKSATGMTITEAIGKGICTNCRQPAIERCYSEAGKREYYISGLCEICFDKITME